MPPSPSPSESKQARKLNARLLPARPDPGRTRGRRRESKAPPPSGVPLPLRAFSHNFRKWPREERCKNAISEVEVRPSVRPSVRPTDSQKTAAAAQTQFLQMPRTLKRARRRCNSPRSPTTLPQISAFHDFIGGRAGGWEEGRKTTWEERERCKRIPHLRGSRGGRSRAIISSGYQCISRPAAPFPLSGNSSRARRLQGLLLHAACELHKLCSGTEEED